MSNLQLFPGFVAYEIPYEDTQEGLGSWSLSPVQQHPAVTTRIGRQHIVSDTSGMPFRRQSAHSAFGPCTPAASSASAPSSGGSGRGRQPTQPGMSTNIMSKPRQSPEQAVAELTFLQPARQRARRQALGLESGPAAKFANGCEFIGLGSYCQVTNSIMALGLKNFSYPFDWNRSSLQGVRKLVETEFEDFFGYDSKIDNGESIIYKAKWGGSFWHHAVDSPQVQSGFLRRIERFYGRGEVAFGTPRVFVRACNSSFEILEATTLLRTLRRSLPQCKPFLLMLVDLQDRSELLSCTEFGPDVLLALIDGSHFAEGIASWTAEKQCDLYAQAIAEAILHWSGSGSSKVIRRTKDVTEVTAVCRPYYGGDTLSETYYPVSIQDHEDFEKQHCSVCSTPSTLLGHWFGF